MHVASIIIKFLFSEIPGSGFSGKVQIFHRVKYITGQYVGFTGLLEVARLNCSLQLCNLL